MHGVGFLRNWTLRETSVSIHKPSLSCAVLHLVCLLGVKTFLVAFGIFLVVLVDCVGLVEICGVPFVLKGAIRMGV